MMTKNSKSIFNQKRRLTLKSIASGALAGLTPISFVSQSASAQSVNNGTIVLIFLEGGCDGIHMLPPKLETSAGSDFDFLYGVGGPRENAASGFAPLEDRIFTDNRFALHPSMSAIRELWENKKVVFFPATHVDIDLSSGIAGSFSHFTGKAIIDAGFKGNRKADAMSVDELGWIARALPNSTDLSITQALSIGNSAARALAGDNLLYRVQKSIYSPLTEPGRLKSQYELVDNLRDYYDSLSMQINCEGTTACRAINAYNAVYTQTNNFVGRLTAENIVSYPGGFGQQMAEVAVLIKSIPEIQFVTLSMGGYDHHTDMSVRLANNLQVLGDSMKAFHDDLNPLDADNENYATLSKDVRVVVITEFGRSVTINNGSGSDHGQAFSAMAMNCASAPAYLHNIAYGNKNHNVSWRTDNVTNFYQTMIPSGGSYSNYVNAITDYRDVLNFVVQKSLPTLDLTATFQALDDGYVPYTIFDI